MEVLLVDDEPYILEQSEIFLEKEEDKLNIDTSPSAEKALALLDEHDYDAIVSDYQMPEMDGLEFLEVVREKKESDIPFIIFTGKGREEVAIEALNMGADHYLQKGGDPKSQYGILAHVIVQEVERYRTEQKETEEKLEKSRKRFNTLLSNTPAVIYTYKVVDGTPETTYVSESVRDVLGHEPEYYTSDPQNFFNDLHPEDAQELSEKEENLLTDDETDRITAEYRFKDKQGNYHWLHDEQQLNTYEDGTREVIGAWWDITERKEAEKREEFLHSLLRHDVRNKSQVVQGYLELLENTDLSEEQEEWIEKARKASENETDIIEKVRTLREIGEREETEEVNVSSVIKKVINRRVSQASGKGINIEYEGVDSKVLAGGLLEELVSNLVENSIKHSGGNKIRVTSREKNECIVAIEDDGQGISDEYKDKIFEKGFKSGDTGGSGLGMYLVKKIIESYNGNIEVEDSELGGARFNIYLKKA